MANEAADVSAWQPVNVEEALSDSNDVQPRSAPFVGKHKAIAAALMGGAALLGLAFTASPPAKAPAWMPAGVWSEEIQQLDTTIHGAFTHHTEECMNALGKAFEDVQKTLAIAEQKCANLTWPTGNQTQKDHEWTPGHWECSSANAAHNQAKEKHQHIVNGNCNHEGFFHCTVATIFGDVDYKRTSCFADVCKPSNIIKDRLRGFKKDAQCMNNTEDGFCAVEVLCDGYDQVHVNFTGEQIDAYNLTHADIQNSGAGAQGAVLLSGLLVVAAALRAA